MYTLNVQLVIWLQKFGIGGTAARQLLKNFLPLNGVSRWTTLFASNSIEYPNITDLLKNSVNLLEENVKEENANANNDANNDTNTDNDDNDKMVSTNADKKGDELDHLFSSMSALSNEFAESQDILGKRMDDKLKIIIWSIKKLSSMKKQKSNNEE